MIRRMLQRAPRVAPVTQEGFPSPAVLSAGAVPGGGVVRLSGLWLWVSLTAALFAAAGSAVGLFGAAGVYGKETAALADVAAAQDIANLFLVAPLLIACGIGASRGSARAYLGWVGCVAFTAYNYAIYAFSVQFGPLFLGGWRCWACRSSRSPVVPTRC